MKFYQTRKYDMTVMVAAVLKKQKQTLANRVPALADLVDEFIMRQESVLKMRIAGPHRMTVKTLTKKSTRDGFVKAILELSAMLRASRYNVAGTAKKQAQEGKSRADTYHYTRSELNRAKAEHLLKIARQVIDASKKTKFAARYGITEGDIKEAEAYYDEFAGIRNAPLRKKKEVAKENKDLNARLNGLVEMLENSIDPLMLIATKDDQELRFAYNASRKVLYRGRGAISDQEQRYRKSRERKKKPGEEGGETAESA